MAFISALTEVGFSGILDIAFMSLLIYTLLLFFKKTKAAFVLTGLLIIGGIYLLTRQFNMVLTAGVLEKFFAVILVAIVVIFQEELRSFFEQVAVFSLKKRTMRRKPVRLTHKSVETIVRTVTDLAREKIGALIVFKKKDMLIRHLDGGVDLNGELSEPLLKSLFDPHSIGHDGAVLIERNRITKFSCHLPLSKDVKKLTRGGTRHAAALGLVELSDALCLVVSEERGTISVARDGDLQEITDPVKLATMLEKFYQEIDPIQTQRPWHGYVRENLREKIIAVAIAVLLWFVLVNGAKWTYRNFTIPVEYAQLPDQLTVSEIDPKEIDATFSGPRRAFYFFSKERIKLFVKLKLREGTHRIRISASSLQFPKNLILENIDPREIRVKIDKVPDKSEGNGKS